MKLEYVFYVLATMSLGFAIYDQNIINVCGWGSALLYANMYKRLSRRVYDPDT